MDNTSSMYVKVRLNRDSYCFFPVESKDCMKSASYKYRKMSARRGAQFVPIGMLTVCLKTFPAKTTKILSTRKSSILMMSSSDTCIQNQSAPSQNMFRRALKPNFCIYGYRLKMRAFRIIVVSHGCILSSKDFCYFRTR